MTTNETVGPMLKSKANTDEAKSGLTAQAKQAALKDMFAVNQKLVDVKHSKRVSNKQADSAKTVTKTSKSTGKEEIIAKTAAKAPKTAKAKPLYIQYLIQLIEEGKYTRKELYDKTVAKYPEVAKSTITTRLTDGFNIKYTCFGRLLVKAADGTISFAK